MKNIEFIEPENMENARDRLVEIQSDILMIEAQLSESKDISGEDLDKGWKHKARYALACKRSERIQLKHWIWKTKKTNKRKLDSALDTLYIIYKNKLNMSVEDIQNFAKETLEEIKNM